MAAPRYLPLQLNQPFSVRLPEGEIVHRASQIAQDGPFAARVGQALAQRYPPWPPAEVVEKRIYEGFPGRADEGRMQAFHAATWAERAEITEAFEDDRLRELGRRILFFEHSEVLKPETRRALETWLQNRLHGREGVEAGRSLQVAIDELENLTQEKGKTEEVVAIRDWLTSYPNADDAVLGV